MFDKRGLTQLSNDYLVDNVLYIFSIVIGGATGYFALLFQSFHSNELTSLHHPITTAFFLGFFIGLVLSFVLLSIVDSSVNTIIISYAGSPLEVEQNHPSITKDLKVAWKDAWQNAVSTVRTKMMLNNTDA